jgi:hypothetical protein
MSIATARLEADPMQRRVWPPPIVTATFANRDIVDRIWRIPSAVWRVPSAANIARSGLDEHFAAKCNALGPEYVRAKHRRAGGGKSAIYTYPSKKRLASIIDKERSDFGGVIHGDRATQSTSQVFTDRA